MPRALGPVAVVTLLVALAAGNGGAIALDQAERALAACRALENEQARDCYRAIVAERQAVRREADTATSIVASEACRESIATEQSGSDNLVVALSADDCPAARVVQIGEGNTVVISQSRGGASDDE